MFKKAVFLAVLILALSFGSAFAYQIDSLASSAGDVPPTQLFVNPGGLGDALLYGYYNVRGQDTFFTITNTSANTGARVRIRFREAATIASQCNGSQEVLDFDICLSKTDMWTGRISTGADGAAKLSSPDTDTFVQTSGDASDASNVTGTRVIFPTAFGSFPSGVSFKFGDNNTVTDITADQTREGYFEVIAERGLRDCTAAEIADKTCSCGKQMDIQGEDVGNVLMGHAIMINLGNGDSYQYSATAIGDFALGDITFGIQSGAPDLASCDDCIAASPAITPVNYALTKSNFMGLYDLEAGQGANTAWVITFPTKWITHDEDGKGSGPKCVDNDSDVFDDTSVVFTIFDDQERKDTPSECEFSPCPGTPGNSLPNEVNVINIQDSVIFPAGLTSEASVTRRLEFRTAAFEFGWIDLDMVAGVASQNPAHETIFGGQVSQGLPAIGYQAIKFGSVKANAMVPLQYKTSIFID
jgi:hypothetical protein